MSPLCPGDLEFKDYYNILEFPPSASGDEIKKAYRRLAHLYHPDKKGNDHYAEAKFADIKEAYEVLSNPSRREDHLQQRWYMKSQGKKLASETVNPVVILKKMIELDRYVSKLDANRLNHDALFDQIGQVLTDANIEILNKFGDAHINNEISRVALKSGHGLPFRVVQLLAARLKKINITDDSVKAMIDQFVSHHERIHFWERKKIWLVVLIVILICLAIFFS